MTIKLGSMFVFTTVNFDFLNAVYLNGFSMMQK